MVWVYPGHWSGVRLPVSCQCPAGVRLAEPRRVWAFSPPGGFVSCIFFSCAFFLSPSLRSLPVLLWRARGPASFLSPGTVVSSLTAPCGGYFYLRSGMRAVIFLPSSLWACFLALGGLTYLSPNAGEHRLRAPARAKMGDKFQGTL